MVSGMCHQRVIREREAKLDNGGLFGYPEAVIKKATCELIPYSMAKQVILKYEWLGTMPSQTVCSYGLFYDGVLAGVVCFSDVRQQQKMSFNGYPAIILARGACVHWAHRHSASKLISSAVSKLDSNKYNFVVGYSDPEAGEIGTVYQACNWYCVGTVQKKRWIGPNGEIRSAYHHRNMACTRTPKVDGARKTDKLLAEKIKQELIDAGWKWEDGPVRYRYVYPLGKGKTLKEMRKILDKIKIPYPKRTEPTKKYKCEECGCEVEADDTVWTGDIPYHVECCPPQHGISE
jgi:hypothetical protein